MITTLILFLTVLLFIGCSENNVAGGTSIDKGIVALGEWKVEGVSQKGPFIIGSTVSVLELGGNSLLQTGKVFKSSIKSDKGDFSVMGPALASQYAMIEVTGYYRNEITGLKSTSPLTLNAIVDLSDREKANVNLLTHLEYERVKHLVSEGMSVKDAKAQAQREILETMAMSESKEAFEDLNIFEAGDANAKLLAISILLQRKEDVAGFTESLAKFSMELAQNGSWNDSATRTSIADWAYEMERLNKFEEIRNNILGWGISDSLPDFEKYITLFWVDNYGLGKCSDSNKGHTAPNTNPLSRWATNNPLSQWPKKRFICDGSRWINIADYKVEFETMTDDRDGKTYKTFHIDEQVWMAQNLNYDYQTEITHSTCYNDTQEYCDLYGRLYTLAAAVDSAGLFGSEGLGCSNSNIDCNLEESSRGVCPKGWHLPSKGEWEQLFTSIGDIATIATIMKAENEICRDNDGLNNIHKEICERNSGFVFRAFDEEYPNASFWTSTIIRIDDEAFPTRLVFPIYTDFFSPTPSFRSVPIEYGISVRCVMD
ncbi:MAG: hypothetical protein J6W54_00855 [Fibrobacter sp.]|uniref:FISUMP domain-containing protein n=1 Tax=Fibrobacter sp. TaxID=35828 RepID=UPI001B0B74F4|nr:FISUMP domain-containing protein [Fibrobacter sp.]MBO7059635.1 hypothetical protein [Fibrobacter sp.]